MAQSWRSHRARLAAARRHHPDADTTDLRVELRAARAEEYIRDLVDQAPPLTEAQREKLAGLLLPAQRSAASKRGDAA